MLKHFEAGSNNTREQERTRSQSLSQRRKDSAERAEQDLIENRESYEKKHGLRAPRSTVNFCGYGDEYVGYAIF